MKTIHAFSVGIIFIMLSLNVTAQNGGMIIKDLSATNAILVGNTASEMIDLSNGALVLPPLTDGDIQSIPNKRKGMIVFSSSADELQYYNGSSWQSIISDKGIGIEMLPCEGIAFLDQDGNTFGGVKIGGQCWMDRNLKVTTYPDGTAITPITDKTAWANLADDNTDEAYCYHNNEPDFADIYGYLYTYAAAIANNWTKDNNDGQGICPDGWHLPTDGEWTTLSDYLGGEDVAGGKMKEAGTSHWYSPNIGATNESGFTALPGGDRNYFGTFGNADWGGYWWSATEDISSFAWFRSLHCDLAIVYRNCDYKSNGFSVRCLRDY